MKSDHVEPKHTGAVGMNKRRVHIGIHGTDLEFVFDVDPGVGEVSMLDDAVKRAKATLRRSGTKGAMRTIRQEPDAWVDIEEESPEQQIDRLTSFIAASMQGKANQGEGVVDIVIRVLKEFMYTKYVVEDEPADDFRRWVKENLGPTPKEITEENYKKALGALRKEALLYREMQKSMSLGPALVCRMLEDIHVGDEEAEL